MLGFTLAAIALVEIADSLNSGVWASEGSLSFIVGGFSGFLLNESGADFAKHGWRAFALLMACAIFVFAAFSLRALAILYNSYAATALLRAAAPIRIAVSSAATCSIATATRAA